MFSTGRAWTQAMQGTRVRMIMMYSGPFRTAAAVSAMLKVNVVRTNRGGVGPEACRPKEGITGIFYRNQKVATLRLLT